jgi:RNA polymerase sigma-70 factor, ECF subfamily
MPVSDERLAQQALGGHADAFDTLVRRYYQRVLGLCRKLLGDPEAAHDAAQEVFVRAYSKLHLYDPSRRFSAWLLTVATRLCISRSQRRGREPHPREELTEADGGVADEGPSPPEQAERAELAERVAEAVRSLPELYKPVCILRHIEGLSYPEIAEATGLPIGTVKIHLFRAKTHLRESLSDLIEAEASEHG